MYRISDQVVIREQAGRAFLLDIETSRYYELNHTGLLVWTAIANGEDPARALADAYPTVDSERLGRDLEAVLEELLAAALIRTSDR